MAKTALMTSPNAGLHMGLAKDTLKHPELTRITTSKTSASVLQERTVPMKKLFSGRQQIVV